MDSGGAHHSIPFCPLRPASIGWRTFVISVTRSAAATRSGCARRPVITTCWVPGRAARAALMKSIPASALEGAESRDIKIPAGQGRTHEFKGLEMLQTWAIPHVFFHVTTAYAILRHNGVEIGKRDFIGR